MEVVGQVAAVAQLVGYVGGLIFKIKRAADTAKQNKRDCHHLVLHLSNIDETLRGQPQDPEVAQLLVQLTSTLEEAHILVVACQKSDIFKVKKLFHASSDANKFKEIKDRITSHLNLFPMASHRALVRRLEQIILHVQQDSRRMAQGSSSSGSVQTQIVASHVSTSTVSDDQPRTLTWAEVQAATENLAYVIGEGFSGKVYEGRLHHGGRLREVAVKVLHKHGRQSMHDASVAELETLFPIRHNHIARLVGWCWEWERPMFVYAHMGNGTLRDHLSGMRGSSPVESSWKARVEVLLGVSRALLHLHCFATPQVIHRNVSSSNILLDKNWTSHLSDFGTAVLRAAGGHSQPVEEVVGTFGYIDPEYSRTRRVSPASDVYSLGVVMLEVLTGRPPVSSANSGSSSGKVTLVSSAFPVIRNGDLQNVLDGRRALVTTSQHFKTMEIVAYTALLCLLEKGEDRLAMSDVVANLEEALEIIRSDET